MLNIRIGSYAGLPVSEVWIPESWSPVEDVVDLEEPMSGVDTVFDL